jgi:anti-sigma B factor antagonist
VVIGQFFRHRSAQHESEDEPADAVIGSLAAVSLRAEITDVAGRAVVVLTGSADLSTVPTLQNALARVVVDRQGEIVAVDLDAVDTVDDVALGLLLGAAGRARRNGGDIVIVCANEHLRDRFAVTGLDRAITVTTSLADL